MLNIQNFNIKWNMKLYSHFCYTKVKKIKLDMVRGTKWYEKNLFRKKSERCLCMKLCLIFNCWKWSKEILGEGNKGLKRRNKALEKCRTFQGVFGSSIWLEYKISTKEWWKMFWNKVLEKFKCQVRVLVEKTQTTLGVL